MGSTGLALVFSLWILLTVLSDIASDMYDPAGLEEEVQELAGRKQFRSRFQEVQNDLKNGG